MIILFSTNCPKCKVLEAKLTKDNIDFTICQNVDELIDKGILEAPILKIDKNTYLNFSEAIKWIKENEK